MRQQPSLPSGRRRRSAACGDDLISILPSSSRRSSKTKPATKRALITEKKKSCGVDARSAERTLTPHGWAAHGLAPQSIESLVPRLRLIDLSAADYGGRAARIGVRGGALFDFLHLHAARKASAAALYTMNVRHFAALARSGDPDIESSV